MESDAKETNGKERVGQVVKEINRPQSKTPLRYMTLMEDIDVAEVGRIELSGAVEVAVGLAMHGRRCMI